MTEFIVTPRGVVRVHREDDSTKTLVVYDYLVSTFGNFGKIVDEAAYKDALIKWLCEADYQVYSIRIVNFYHDCNRLTVGYFVTVVEYEYLLCPVCEQPAIVVKDDEHYCTNCGYDSVSYSGAPYERSESEFELTDVQEVQRDEERANADEQDSCGGW